MIIARDTSEVMSTIQHDFSYFSSTKHQIKKEVGAIKNVICLKPKDRTNQPALEY